jgi:hypothetical protein
MATPVEAWLRIPAGSQSLLPSSAFQQRLAQRTGRRFTLIAPPMVAVHHLECRAIELAPIHTFEPNGIFDVLVGRDILCRGAFHMSFNGHAVLSV